MAHNQLIQFYQRHSCHVFHPRLARLPRSGMPVGHIWYTKKTGYYDLARHASHNTKKACFVVGL